MAHIKTPHWHETQDLDDLLADDITLAVMRADNVTPSEIRSLFRKLPRTEHHPAEPRACWFSFGQ